MYFRINIQQTGDTPTLYLVGRRRVMSPTVELGDSPLTCNTKQWIWTVYL